MSSEVFKRQVSTSSSNFSSQAFSWLHCDTWQMNMTWIKTPILWLETICHFMTADKFFNTNLTIFFPLLPEFIKLSLESSSNTFHHSSLRNCADIVFIWCQSKQWAKRSICVNSRRISISFISLPKWITIKIRLNNLKLYEALFADRDKSFTAVVVEGRSDASQRKR